MSELEKKAKTGNFIKDLALRYDSAKEHLWVRLEDAQKEIDGLWIQIRDHRKTIDILETERKTLANFLQKERELKQKLDAFHGFLVITPTPKEGGLLWFLGQETLIQVSEC